MVTVDWIAEPFEEPPMSDMPTQELVESLQRSVRRWRALAITLLASLGVVVVLGIGTVTVLRLRARQQARAAEQAAMEARDQAHQAMYRLRIQAAEKEVQGK
jgi:hypothetical protein